MTRFRTSVKPGTVASYFAAQVVPGLVALVTIPLWVHLVGVENYGRFALVWVIAISCVAVGTGWVRQAALRHAGAPQSSFLDLPRKVVVASVILPGMACGAASLILVSGRSPLGLVVPGAFAGSLSIAVLVQVVLQRREQARTFAVVEVIRSFAAVLFTLLGLQLEVRGDQAMLIGAALGNLVGVGAVGIRRLKVGEGARSSAVAWAWWSYGWPMSIWLGIAPVLLYTDRMVLSFVVTPAELGEYAAISDLIVRGIGVIGLPLTMALFPLIMKAANEDRGLEVAREVRYWTGVLLLALAGGSVIALTAGPSLVALILGLNVVPRSIVVLLALAAGMWQVALIVHMPLALADRTKAMLVLLLLSLSAEATVSVSLVARFGDQGVAMGVAVGAMVYLFSVGLYSRWLRVVT